MDALVKLRSIIYNLLNYQEFPRLIDVKRRTFATGLTNFAELKQKALGSELELLKSIEDHYQAYLEE